MVWRRIASKLAATAGLVSGGTAIWWCSDKTKQQNTVYASWTSGFVPSVKWDFNWDRRNPEDLVKPVEDKNDEAQIAERKKKIKELKPTAVRHLILIRHGQYHMNGSDKGTLTSLGQEQAAFTGKRLQELGFDYDFMVYSTMPRATETAEIIHKFLPNVEMTSCNFLREGSPIPPEPPIGNWKPEAQFYEDGARIEAAYRKYIHRADASQSKDSYEVYVFHANVIRYFVCRALQFPPEAWLRLSLHNGSITWLTVRPNGRVTLRELGDCGHIPANKLSTS
ncbi:serine/threonine-protein phosphatase PGAM5, mitochondrial-like isoform X2 [Tubulanus polymorphus]|uniref:serine/threonine-protein phosphatase PGAM5, mitochondrial-like isoform X2 n=1 Tax=Tubulanus polymorphus TaxID=672921 RepID=UPI003DA2C846